MCACGKSTTSKKINVDTWTQTKKRGKVRCPTHPWPGKKTKQQSWVWSRTCLLVAFPSKTMNGILHLNQKQNRVTPDEESNRPDVIKSRRPQRQIDKRVLSNYSRAHQWQDSWRRKETQRQAGVSPSGPVCLHLFSG